MRKCENVKIERKQVMAKTYFQPEVTVASIALQSNLLAGSPAALDVKPASTSEVW
jgi:hypothetical protein